MRKVKLSNIIDAIESGSRPKGGKRESGIPSIGAGELNDHGGFSFNKLGYIPLDYFEKLNRGIINSEDVIVVKDGATTGKTSFVDHNFPYKRAAVNEHVFILRVDRSAILPKYLFYFLYSPIGFDNIMEDFRGATVGGISQKFINKIKIPLPSLSDQKAIVAKLDRAQRLIDIDKEMLAKYDELIQSVFLEMFGDPVTNPKGWRKLKLKDFCEFENGDRSSNYPSGDDIKESGKLFLSSGDIQNGKFTVKDSKFISDEKFDSLKRGKCKTGDVLVTLRGSGTGKTAVFDCQYDEGFINAQMVILRPDSKCLSEYLVRQLNCPPVFKRLINLNSGSAQPQLSATSLKKFEVLVPAIEIQKQYERKARQIEREKKQIKISLKKSEELFSSLVKGAFG